MSKPPIPPREAPAWVELTDCLARLQRAARRHAPGTAERLVLDEAAARLEGIRAVYAEAVLVGRE